MAEETTRTASAPTTGMVRDSVRTTLAFALFWLLTKIVGAEMAESMGGAVEAVVVILTSALFAFIGKLSRNKADEEHETPVVGSVV